MRRNSTIAALVVALLASAVSSPAFAESESDGGYFDFFSDGGKIGNRFVTWVWAPHYFPGGIDYRIFLLCFREDAAGNRIGSNKVTIRNIAFLGADSGLLLEFRKVSQKLSRFHNNGYLILNTPDLSLLANDDFVFAEVQFQIKGSSGRDQIKCSADVTESPQGLAAGEMSEVRVKPAPQSSLIEVLSARPTVE